MSILYEIPLWVIVCILHFMHREQEMRCESRAGMKIYANTKYKKEKKEYLFYGWTIKNYGSVTVMTVFRNDVQ